LGSGSFRFERGPSILYSIYRCFFPVHLVVFYAFRSEVLSIYQRFAAMVLPQFSTPIRVFRADSAGEYISKQLRGVLAE
jgi:hypothetical protein